MPAKSEFAAQPEIGVLGLREPRRSDSVICRGSSAVGRNSFRARTSGNGMRSARGPNENANPNIGGCGTGTNGRRSPRLGSCSGSHNNKPLFAYGTSRHPGADITNVASSRGQGDKVKLNKQPMQTPATYTATLPVPTPVAEPLEERHTPSAYVDETERSNVQNVAEYVVDIYNDMFHDETAFLPRANYMESQVDITARMRMILIDWLIEVHMKYRLRSETLHLTVNLVDRYLTRMPVMRKRLQLIGVVAMFIASKFEEIHPPELHDWVYITDNAYTKEDVLVMECNMLSTLSFQVMVPTAAHFFEGLQKANDCTGLHREIAQYLLELGLLDIRMLAYKPSHVVSAALLLSNELMGRNPVWPAAMVQHSRHAETALRGCAEELRQLHEADVEGAGGQLQAVHKKFSQAQHHVVAKMTF